MGLWDDVLTVGGGAVGGVGGFFAGGPAGAAVGASLGGSLGHAIGGRVDGTPGEEEAKQLAALYDNLKYTDPSSDPRYAAALKQLQEYEKGGLTPEDRAREYEALGSAQNFAAGESGAIAQDAAARGGGGAGVNSVRAQVAAQGTAKRLGSADVAIAGDAAKRAFAAQQEFARQMQINTEMQNQFAEWKAGGQAAGIKNLQDLKEREASAQNANTQGLLNSVGGMGLSKLNLTAPATTATATALPSTTGQAGYASSGNIGIPLPGRSSSTLATGPTTAADFGSTPTTADAAAQAYAASLPFAQMAAPGSSPSTASDDQRKRGY